ncbi:hypothetical protein C2G38_2107726 [Gigaspora rosea]|uniref:Uncharacterized protein n=1 Tax=Gigaspora rosea TaxID=44941 RepID=A0A397UQR0_9GLOM|nr:hypothetical protein C2G38_2107726 [Gigaspora rosea]
MPMEFFLQRTFLLFHFYCYNCNLLAYSYFYHDSFLYDLLSYCCNLLENYFCLSF